MRRLPGSAPVLGTPGSVFRFLEVSHGTVLVASLTSEEIQSGLPHGRKEVWQNRFVPSLEALADRIVPTVFHVTTLTDGVDGSLRDAVTRANAHAGADTVVFASELAGTIALTGGELDITDDLAVNGPGAARLTVSGNNTSRVFKVEAGETVRLSGLTIAGGNAGLGFGGGIYNFGTLTVSDSVLSGNSATTGGGLFNGGTATVRDSIFTSNTASGSFPVGGEGGGLANESGGTVTVTGSIFTHNSALIGGGLRNDTGGTATVRNSTFSGNSAAAAAGGLMNRGTASVSDSAFTGNSAFNGGGLDNPGTATVSDSTFTGNSATGAAGGLANGGTVTVRGSTFTGNSASVGGGIGNVGTATVSDSTFTGNSAGVAGGGIANADIVLGGVRLRGTLTVSDSTFTDNSAGVAGGGIDNGGTATVSGSTFTGNTAGSGNGGLANEPGGLLTQFDNQFINDQSPDVFP